MQSVITKRAVEIYPSDDFRSVGNHDLCILTNKSGDIELAAMQDELEDYTLYRETSDEIKNSSNPSNILSEDIISDEEMKDLLQYLKSEDLLDDVILEI
jgi:hypothetical protein